MLGPRQGCLRGLVVGLALTASPAWAQTGESLPEALPNAPGMAAASPANLGIEIHESLSRRPMSVADGVPINLPAAFRLAGVQPVDIAAAETRVEQAMGLLLQAKALKIPNLNGGFGYYRHDGANQNLFTGQPFEKGTNAYIIGGGPTINLNLTDAIFAPLAARRVVASRRADVQGARNNVLNTAAQQYFTVQEARGRLVGAEATIARSERLVRFAEGLAPTLIAPLEINRARAQLEGAKQYRETTVRDWRVASAQLAELLLLDPMLMLDPVEPPFLAISLIPPEWCQSNLVPVALQSRPEIASQRELLVAAEQTLRREKARPFLPNLVITSPGTANAGVLSAGQFYAGDHDNAFRAGNRADFTVGAYWQLANAGFGNAGLIRQRRGEANAARVEVTRILFRVQSEVSQATARLQTANSRVPFAEQELRQAIESADKNFVGLRETTRPAGELLNLVVRPQEVVAALQALNQAFQDYASAIGEYNRAQFELYRALGQPAQLVTSLRKPVGGAMAEPPGAPATLPPPTTAEPAPPPPPPPGRNP